jgi:cell division protein FtsL
MLTRARKIFLRQKLIKLNLEVILILCFFIISTMTSTLTTGSPIKDIKSQILTENSGQFQDNANSIILVISNFTDLPL